MAAMGFTPADYAHEVCELWPENWPAWQLFCTLSTQWRTGMAVPTGLDYTPAFHLMARMQLDPEAWDHLFDDLRALESAALDTIRSQKA